MWQKTGCLTTADRSEDQLIKPEGLKNYVVPPPAYLPPSACLFQVEENPVSGAEDMVSEEEADPEDPCEELPDTDMAEIQGLKIEITTMVLLERKSQPCIKMAGSKNNCLFQQRVKGIQSGLCRQTSDYLSFHDFDGVEVILEPHCGQ